MKGKIHSFESFGTVDGPGIRYVIFFKGCPLRCKYCHNPDTWSQDGAEEWEAQDIVNQAMKYKGYWGDKGGVTITGGEPLLQLDFAIELLRLFHEQGVRYGHALFSRLRKTKYSHLDSSCTCTRNYN